MKKFCITFLLSGIIMLTAFIFGGVYNGDNKGSGERNEYFRIHIRANSDEASEQAVKYLVRDKVVEYLTPLVAQASSKEAAVSLTKGCLYEIERVANAVLTENGFFYSSRAQVKKERFPVRVYGEFTLPEGEYDALIVELGEGKGQNWWCVVYPPLCFTGVTGENIKYKSIIKERIDAWREGR